MMSEKRKKPPRYGGKSSVFAQKLRFQPLGKLKTPIFCVSNPLESQNHLISAFPTPWKVKNTQKLRFQPLGKSKSLNFCVSNPLESQKHPKTAFPTPWKAKNTQFLRFQPLGKVKTNQKLRFPTLGKSKLLKGESYKRRS